MKYEDKYHPSDHLIFRSLEEEEYELTSDQLVSLRARRFPRDHRAHLHYHNTIEININNGVKGFVWIEGDRKNLEDMDVLVTPPGTMHSFDFIGGEGVFDVLHISLTKLSSYLNLEQIFGTKLVDLKNISCNDPAYTLIKSPVKRMKDIDEQDIFSQLRLILEILGIIFNESAKNHGESRDSPVLKTVIDYTELNYSKKIDLDEIASVAGLSRSYFSRYFKKMTGTGYFTYLTLMRLERAKKKIRSGDSVTDSCYSSGFDNISYFIQLFKKHNNGISPGKYRMNQ